MNYALMQCYMCVVITVHGFVSTCASSSHALKDLQRNAVNKRNFVSSYTEAMEVLQRYGYLNCRIPSKKSTIHQRTFAYCTHSDVRSAIRLYQRRYKLPPTGKLTPDTLLMMSQSRCGNADVGKASEMSPVKVSLLTSPEVTTVRQKREVQNKNGLKFVKKAGCGSSSKWIDESSNSGQDSMKLRQQWMDAHIRSIQTGEHDKKLAELHMEIQNHKKQRRRRSADMVEAFALDIITWRLLGSDRSQQFSKATQRAALSLAFRMWSEVMPPIFVEDSQSHVNDVDILVAFGKGSHLNCPNKFDGLGGQLSHAMKSQDAAEIHMDDDEQFTVGSEEGTNLVKVTVHEVGHVLGLHHVKQNQSIMYAIYSQVTPNSNFELRSDDRKLIQKIYGICKGSYDVVFDWIRKKPSGQYIYNTFFFRSKNNWMYENRFNRTRFGDPLLIGTEWKGIPNNIDAFAHIWTRTSDKSLFFKGHLYWQYDGTMDRIMKGYPKNITENFKAKSNSNFSDIPGNLDSIFFDKRDGNLYFFKDNLVYAYEVAKGKKGCCLKGYPKRFHEEFPTDVLSQSLEGYVDSVYYSYTERTMYIFKGTQFWNNIAYNVHDRNRRNLLIGPFDINDKWHDICDVEIAN